MASYFFYYSIIFCIFFHSSSCQEQQNTKHVRLVVAKDGSRDYKTINEALREVPNKINVSTYIYIKEGIYKEYVVINSSMWSVVLTGAGPKTIITGTKFHHEGQDGTQNSTYHTATLTVLGDNFICTNLSILNEAGREKGPVVALLMNADKAVVLNCTISGFQDTLYTFVGRQLYQNCTIEGTIDFICGKARTVLSNCTINVLQPLKNQTCIITAQHREKNDTDQRQAIMIQGSTISPKPYFKCNSNCLYKTFLGRPWGALARTIIVNSELSSFVEPEGWMPWNTSQGLDKCWYTEINNTGDGNDTHYRVNATGIKNYSDISIDRNDYLESFWKDLDYAWPT